MPKNAKNKKYKMYKNVLLLGLSGIIAKLFDFSFRAFYAGVLGTEGMGLLSLGFSMHGVMLTIATAGLGVAVSRCTSVYIERGNPAAVKKCMKMAVFGVSTLALTVILITFLFSDKIAERLLGDGRISFSLCTLMPSVLFMGISYCTKGCFYAERRVLPPASSEILEQAVKFVSIRVLLKIFLPFGIEYGCAAVFGGITMGELSSCVYLLFWYRREERLNFRLEAQETAAPSRAEMLTKLLGVSVPSMITSLCCSALRMQEEVLIISALERGNMPHGEAVSALGVMCGMVMPLLVLPLNLTGSVMSLLVPEISRAEARGGGSLRRTVKKVYGLGMTVGIVVGLFFMIFGGSASRAFYKTDAAAELVVCLAPLCPVMFMDSLSCSILNGLGKQLRLLLFSLLDFALRLSVIYFAMPRYGTSAFAAMTAASNIFTCMLSLSGVLWLVWGEKYIFKLKLTKSAKCAILKHRER